jgi:hypothetical protein
MPLATPRFEARAAGCVGSGGEVNGRGERSNASNEHIQDVNCVEVKNRTTNSSRLGS